MSERLSEEECQDLQGEIRELKKATERAEGDYQQAKDDLLKEINKQLKEETGYDLNDLDDAQTTLDETDKTIKDLGLDEYFDNIDGALDAVEAADTAVAELTEEVEALRTRANQLAELILGDGSISGTGDSSQHYPAYQEAKEELDEKVVELTEAQRILAEAVAEVNRLNEIINDVPQDEIDELDESRSQANEDLNTIVDAIAEARRNNPELDKDMQGYNFNNHDSYKEPQKNLADARKAQSEAQNYHDQHCGESESDSEEDE